jgi:alpha-1,2-mannosyltransferase
MNPPHFHLLVLPLARLSPGLAVTIWIGLSLFALVVSLLVIGREMKIQWTPVRVLAAAAGTLAFAGTQSFFVTGQLSLLLLLALTICWVAARHDRWPLAGALLGACLSIKPFLLIFLPYLLGTRRFRALTVTLVTAAGAFLVGLLVFGPAAYASWYRALAASGDWAWTVMNASAFGFFRRAFDAQPIATPLVIAPRLVRGWIAAAALVGIVTFIAAIRDRATGAIDRAFGLLLVAAQLISPLGWIYYLWLPAGPVAAAAFGSRPDGSRRRAARGLAIAAAIGFAWPMPLLMAFQPHAWATLLVASIYFWATLALWMWLLLDVHFRTTASDASV